jgi:hypothetical protein
MPVCMDRVFVYLEEEFSKRGNFKMRLACAVLFCLAGIASLNAQSPAASILGTVTDPSGAAVPDVAVHVKNVGTGFVQSINTDGQGRFRVPDLGIGEYEVTASKEGFSTVVHSGITVTVGSQNVVDFSLTVGATQQTVNVAGQVSQVETTSSAVSTLVESTQMRELPLNGRNVSQLLSLAPGVQSLPGLTSRYGSQANFSVAGSRGEGQWFLLDNVNTTGFYNHATGSGATGNSLGIEGIAEFQTLTNTYSAQYGGNGAVINAVTKSGTNALHGAAYEFHRNSVFDARNFFDTYRKPGSTDADVPSFHRNQFGGALGGPIRKDQSFFFVNYEGLRQSQGQTQTATVPDRNARAGIVNGVSVGVASSVASSLALFPVPDASNTLSTNPVTGTAAISQVGKQVANENYFLMRVDHTFSQKDYAFLRYALDKSDQSNPFIATQVPYWVQEDRTENHYVTLEEKHIFTPNLINLVRVSFVRTAERGAPVPTASTALKYYGASGPDGLLTVTGLSALGPRNTVPFSYIPNHFTEGDDVLWTHGAHSLKFGLMVDRIRDNTFSPFTLAGQYTFPGLVPFLQGRPTLYQGPIAGQADAVRDYRELQVSPYIVDDWKVSRALTVNLGVRYGWAANPTEARHGLTQILNPPYGSGFEPVTQIFRDNPSTKNVDPRVGLAYSPFRNNRTSIRAGFGMFHDIIQAREFIFTYSLAPPYFNTSQVSTPTIPLAYGPAYSSGPANGKPVVSAGMDRRLANTPYMIQYNFNIQQDIGAGMILTAGYVGSQGVHLMLQAERNPPTPDATGHLGTPTGAFGVTAYPRLNPTFNSVLMKDSVGHSNYNSFQIGLNRRFSRGFQLQVSHTYSKSLDNASQGIAIESQGSPIQIQDPFKFASDRGRSDFDQRHTFRLSGVYALPFHGNRMKEGWQLSGLFSATTGTPLTPIIGYDRMGYGGVGINRPNAVSGRGNNPVKGDPNQWFDPTAFALNPIGLPGNLGRNTVQGPGLASLDFALVKDTRITEGVHGQLRAEFFNVLNRTNFGLPAQSVFLSGSAAPNPTAGLVTITNTSSRQIQFALRLVF